MTEMKMVPVEPTDEMVKAGVKCAQNNHAGFVREAYRSMLAASPQAPAREGVFSAGQVWKDPHTDRWIADVEERGSAIVAAQAIGEDEYQAEARRDLILAALTAREEAPAEGAGEREEIIKAVKVAMNDAWCDITSDTDCWPADLKRVSQRGPMRLEYRPSIWTDTTAEMAANAILALRPQTAESGK